MTSKRSPSSIPDASSTESTAASQPTPDGEPLGRATPPDAPEEPAASARKILRFRRSERLVHWAIAIPFIVCWVTALALVVFYNPAPDRPYRALLSWTHRISGVCLAVLPVLAIARCTGDFRLHFHNIAQAWIWTIQDFRWLSLMGLAAINPRVKLPEQGKFNAAEKINFMTLMATYPLYILTGLVIWLTDGAFLAWVVHFLMAMAATPLMLGHIYMAAVNPASRVGLQGMISGYVDRQWAKHHYRQWYREHHEEGEQAPGGGPEDGAADGPPSESPARRVPEERR